MASERENVKSYVDGLARKTTERQNRWPLEIVSEHQIDSNSVVYRT